LVREALFYIGRDMRGFQDSLVGRFRAIMAFDGFGTDPFFGEELDRGAKEVMKESPLLAIEVIEERDNGGVI
jgi:hypothetical protein